MRALLLAGVVAVGSAGYADAAIIDFNTLPGADLSAFTTYSEDGFTVAASAGNVDVAKAYGNPAPDIYFPSPAYGAVTVSASSTPFSFTALDFSSDGALSTQVVGYVISGYYNGSQAFTQSGSADGGSGNHFVTVLATQPNALITSLVISGANVTNGSGAEVDNIVVQHATAVPEPTSLVLLALPLGAVGLIMARRRNG